MTVSIIENQQQIFPVRRSGKSLEWEENLKLSLFKFLCLDDNKSMCILVAGDHTCPRLIGFLKKELIDFDYNYNDKKKIFSVMEKEIHLITARKSKLGKGIDC